MMGEGDDELDVMLSQMFPLTMETSPARPYASARLSAKRRASLRGVSSSLDASEPLR